MNSEKVISNIKKALKEHFDNNYAYDMLVDFELDVIEWYSLFEYIDILKQENKQLKEELEEYKNPIKYFKYANKNVVEENKQLKETYKEVFNNYQKLKKDNETLTLLNIHQSDKIQQLQKELEEYERPKNNWNKLKQKMIDSFNESQDVQFLDVLQDMQELEQGSGGNE